MFTLILLTLRTFVIPLKHPVFIHVLIFSYCYVPQHWMGIESSLSFTVTYCIHILILPHWCKDLCKQEKQEQRMHSRQLMIWWKWIVSLPLVTSHICTLTYSRQKQMYIVLCFLFDWKTENIKFCFQKPVCRLCRMSSDYLQTVCKCCLIRMRNKKISWILSIYNICRSASVDKA